MYHTACKKHKREVYFEKQYSCTDYGGKAIWSDRIVGNLDVAIREKI